MRAGEPKIKLAHGKRGGDGVWRKAVGFCSSCDLVMPFHGAPPPPRVARIDRPRLSPPSDNSAVGGAAKLLALSPQFFPLTTRRNGPSTCWFVELA